MRSISDDFATDGDTVWVLGYTTGSHLGLVDEDESRLPVIWRAVVRDGLVTVWQLLGATPDRRAQVGLRSG